MTPESKNPLQKLRQRKELLVILVFFFVIAVFWIAVSIFASQHTTGITKEQQKSAQPLSPTLNTQVIEALELKKMYTAEELGDFPVVTEAIVQGGSVSEQNTLGTNEVVLPTQLEDQIQTLEENL